jgi:hypothetical protein
MKALSANESSLAAQMATVWLQSHEEFPNDPTESPQFDQMPDLIDQCLADNALAPLDPLLDQAYALISRKKTNEVAAEFLQAILPQFDNITEFEQENPRVGAFIALPVIGFKEHAQTIAARAHELDLTADLVETGMMPQGTQIKWITKPVSLAQAGQWGADVRRNLLVAALEGGSLEDRLPTVEVHGFDRAELSMVVGIAIALEVQTDHAQKDPAFLYANPSDFVDFSGEPTAAEEWALNRRAQAAEEASNRMTVKLKRIGVEDTVIERPGLLTEVLGSLVAWSVRAQQLEEMSMLGWSEADIAHATQEARADVSIDAEQSLLSISMELGGKVWGPYQTDWPWKSLPMLMLVESFVRHELLLHPNQITWHQDAKSMWKSAQSSPDRRWRLQ